MVPKRSSYTGLTVVNKYNNTISPISNLEGEEIVGMFYEKEQQKTNKKRV